MQSPDFQTNLGTRAPVSSPGVPEELCDGEGTKAGLTQKAPQGSSFPPRARSCRRGGGSRLGTGTCCRGGREFSAVNGLPARWQVMANDKHIPLIGTCFFDLP